MPDNDRNRIDWTTAVTWLLIVVVCLAVAYAIVFVLLEIATLVLPPLWAWAKAHADGLTALVVLALAAIVGKGIMEA